MLLIFICLLQVHDMCDPSSVYVTAAQVLVLQGHWRGRCFLRWDCYDRLYTLTFPAVVILPSYTNFAHKN